MIKSYKMPDGTVHKFKAFRAAPIRPIGSLVREYHTLLPLAPVRVTTENLERLWREEMLYMGGIWGPRLKKDGWMKAPWLPALENDARSERISLVLWEDDE